MTRKKLLKIALWSFGILGILGIAGFLFVQSQMLHHSEPSRPPAAVEPSGDPVLDSIRRGVEYLKVHQEEDHHFSKGLLDPKPAVSALVVDAIVKSPDAYRYDEHEFIRNACEAILSLRQDNGGIYTPTFGLGNYCTAISIMALQTAGGERFDEVVAEAKEFLRACQLDKRAGAQAGGFGYGDSGGDADLSNTALSLEALRQAGLAPDDEVFQKAQEFIARCQNSSETNSEAWAGDDGGFIYRPEDSNAGTYRHEDGTIGYRSYGLMSYAGLMSMIHAGVSREDPRVQSAIEWVKSNYTFDENVEIGANGLFYYYLTMAKALDAYGERIIVDDEGIEHDWAREMSAKLVSMQGSDGSWRNTESDRWMEGDSVLVTAYTVRALTLCWNSMQEAQAEEAPEERDE